LIGAEGAAGPGAIEVRLRGVSTILGSAVGLCLGVILVPAALLALLYVPLLGVAMGVVAVGTLLVGAIGVVGGLK
jgi:hypothetical protein